MMRRNVPADRAPGFTLIEMLMVVGLVAVLAMVAMPFYGRYRERIRNDQAVNDIVAMSVLVQGYWMDNRAYPNSLADIQAAGKLDPWGSPYVYYNIDANGKGGARKDHVLNPLNTDFDLYSSGPDGASQLQITLKSSLDDVLRASNGAFVGIAANF